METLPARRVADCWGLFVSVIRSLSPSWCVSGLVGAARFASPGSLPGIEAITSGDEVSMMRREAEVGRSPGAFATNLARLPQVSSEQDP